MFATKQLAFRNANIVYAISALQNASAILPIWLIFFTHQLGISVTAATVLGLSRWFALAVCNIPTGAWSDRFGRVKVYAIGQLGFALSFVPFLLTKNYIVLLAVQLIGGFFGSMSVGALQPLVKDSYDLAKLAPRMYTKFVSNQVVITYVSRLVAGIAGGWLYVKFPYGPYVFEICMLSGAFLLSVFLVEQRVEHATARNNSEHIREALGIVWKNIELRRFFIAMMIVVLATESVWMALQPIFEYRGVSPGYFGLLYALIALCSAGGAYLSRHILDRFSGVRIKFITLLIVLGGMLALLIDHPILFVTSLVVFGFSFGFTDPTNEYAVQETTSSKHQSTVLSLQALLYTGGYSVVGVVVGRYVDVFGTGTMLRILTVQAIFCAFFVGIILYFARRATLQKQS